MSDVITLAHGSGGHKTGELISEVFRKNLGNEYFTSDDAAVMPAPEGRIAMSTDGFIVSPWEFPGGNIGKLSVCGTVNDLACMGAKPLYLTCSYVIEEGFPISELEKVAQAMGETARKAGVKIVAGDTKVAGKGQVDQIFITTAGVGVIPDGVNMSGAYAKPGDKIIVTATRGGVGTVMYEITEQSDVGVKLDREKIPVDDAVRGVTGMLGLEPLYLACEGTMVMICPAEYADKVVEALHGCEHGKGAAIIGEITEENKGRVVMTTEIGGMTYLPKPGNELLPRIC